MSNSINSSRSEILNMDQEKRALERLSKRFNLNELPKQVQHRLLTKEINKIRMEDKLKGIEALRRIKTLRTEEEIADAVNAGYKILKEQVVASENIYAIELWFKNKKTGEIRKESYSYHAYMHDYEGHEVKKVTYYPYTFPSKIAAYLLPDDLQVGERVILDDLIEDIVGVSHASGNYRLKSAEAIWNGERFVIDHDSYGVDVSIG